MIIFSKKIQRISAWIALAFFVVIQIFPPKKNNAFVFLDFCDISLQPHRNITPLQNTALRVPQRSEYLLKYN